MGASLLALAKSMYQELHTGQDWSFSSKIGAISKKLGWLDSLLRYN